jgi:exopolysaccharide biosynthesis polyprenyl glycosylphosphotransferase
LGFNIVGFLDDTQKGSVYGKPVLGKLSDFVDVTKKYFVDNIIITMLPERRAIAELIEQVRKMQLGVMVVPEYFEGALPVVDVNRIGVVPVLTYNTRKPHPSEAFSKKAFDFFASLVLIILFSPLLLIIAVLIKLNSPGPVFFSGRRVGMKGITFNFYKFRSMVQNADELKIELLEQNEDKDKVMFKIKDDPRITRIGRFLRKYSLDELPQLFNVLIGNMSLVGPRPPLLDEVEKYGCDHIDRLSIKPGITGLSQIKGRSDLSFSRWVRWDLWYINNWSFGLDLKILLETIPVVLKGKGAY